MHKHQINGCWIVHDYGLFTSRGCFMIVLLKIQIPRNDPSIVVQFMVLKLLNKLHTSQQHNHDDLCKSLKQFFFFFFFLSFFLMKGAWFDHDLDHKKQYFCQIWNTGWEIINSLWPSDAIWRHISRSTLAQVMACCLTAPSHYLNQCWLISKVQWHS